MSWDGEHAGEYTRPVPTKAPGLVRGQAARRRARGKTVGTHRHALPRRAGRRRVLRRDDARGDAASGSPKTPAAATTTSDNTATLADDLRYTGRGVTTVEEHDLWHMPIVLMLLVGLLCAEWGYRRVVGLA